MSGTSRPPLEVADVFRLLGDNYKQANQGHLSLAQLKVMSAIERCRSAQLGAHHLHCDKCDTDQIAYNSCRNRHCPKCQGTSAKRWFAAREQQLLPVEYYHVVFTLPAEVAQLAFYNKSLMYQLLFRAASQTLMTIAKDPRHLGAEIGATMVLHTWGSAMTHHPHVHCIVPGGGLDEQKQWKACRKGFFLPVRVLSRLFRRLYMQGLAELYDTQKLLCFGELIQLTGFENAAHFTNWCKQQQSREWVVYAKRPFAGPEAVLRYLARYTHRVAIANSRLVSINEDKVTFKYKDYRRKGNNMHRSMQLTPHEFIRRFLLHVLPTGFHRIRHYGLLASKTRLNHARLALGVESTESSVQQKKEPDPPASPFVCQQCQLPMTIMAVHAFPYLPRAPPE